MLFPDNGGLPTKSTQPESSIRCSKASSKMLFDCLASTDSFLYPEHSLLFLFHAITI